MARVSEYRQRVKFIRTVTGKDPINGDQIGTRIPVLETWAKVTPLRGYRALQAGQVLNGHPYKIECRSREDIAITEDLDIEWAGKRITIHSVAPSLEVVGELEITAMEVS